MVSNGGAGGGWGRAGPGPDVCNLTTPIAGCSRDDVMVAVYRCGWNASDAVSFL